MTMIYQHRPPLPQMRGVLTDITTDGFSSLIGYVSSSVSKLCREGGSCLAAFWALTMNATVI